MLLAGVALWSLGTLVAPPAAHFSLLALCASRVFVRPVAVLLHYLVLFFAHAFFLRER